MNGFTHDVGSRIEDPACLVDVIGKGSCGVSLDDAPQPHLVVDLDRTGSPLGGAQSKCDYLLFADPSLVMPIEIKDGAPNVAKVERQLQAGARAADGLAPRGVAILCRPVLVSKALRRQKQVDLRKALVRFRGREERVRRVACGDPLTDVLGSA